MKLFYKIKFLLLSPVFFFSFATHADQENAPKLVGSPLSQGIQWVKQSLEQHPEILWLADANVRKTEEGEAILKGSYSEQLFGQKYVEFDRTMMTIKCLKLILDGSNNAYLEFTSGQNAETKLSPESFQTLHLKSCELLQSKWGGLSESQMIEALETALVLGDMGKSGQARALFKPYGVDAPDHDDFYGEAIQIADKYPEICPSFAKLSHPAQKLLVKIGNLAHYGHITHLEGGLEMLSKMKESQIAANDPIALSFDLFVHTCDVAGALGHVNNQSSLMYTEQTHQAIQATEAAVKVLSDDKKNEWDAYQSYLKVRADWLGLDVEKSSDRVLARIGAMLRLFSQIEGDVLTKAISDLDPETRHRILNQLDVQKSVQSGRTPTYIPAVLLNLSNHLDLGATKEERLSKSIAMGLPFIATVLERYKQEMKEGKFDSSIPLNFNRIAGIAKSFPNYFLDPQFYIDQEGNVIERRNP